MDEAPHCNWLKCRKPLGLEGRAVVTTCSHMFCVECASTLFGPDKACPACETILDDPDSVILQQLSPSAEYRASVLAGLSPSAVMDIATRSLNFWHYQSSQEAAFQSMILKNSQERNTVLEKCNQSLLVEAKSEISLLQQKMENLEVDLNNSSRKNQELAEHLRTRNKEYENLKRQFDKNQRRALLPNPGHLQGQATNQNLFASPQKEAEAETVSQGLFAKNPNTARNDWRQNLQSSSTQVQGQNQKQAAPFWQAQASRSTGNNSNHSHPSANKSPNKPDSYADVAMSGSGNLVDMGSGMGNGMGSGRSQFNAGSGKSPSDGGDIRTRKISRTSNGSGEKMTRTQSHNPSSTFHPQHSPAQKSPGRGHHRSISGSGSGTSSNHSPTRHGRASHEQFGPTLSLSGPTNVTNPIIKRTNSHIPGTFRLTGA